MTENIIAIRDWVIAHPTATVADVMAEFDITYAEFSHAVEVIRTMPAPPAPIWPDDAAAHVAETVDELRGETFQREQLVYASGDTERQMPGRITRLARDGSWADVDWGYWSKRMQTRYLRPAPSVPAFRISAANIADAIEREALAVEWPDEDEE